MKYSLRLLIVFLIISQNINAQSIQWAKRAGLWAFDLGHGIATDNSGNVYIAGKYEMNASFGGTTVPCAGNHDIYVAKYDANGNFLWVRTAGGPSGDYAHAIAVDASGNAYIAGEMEGTVNFGSGVSLTSNGDNDIFVAKYSTNGNLVWARKLGGGSKSDKALGITLSSGSVYLTGKFEDSGNFNGINLVSAGGKDIFVAKYSQDGTFQWAKRAGGTGSDEGYAIGIDPSSNVYVTGYFSGTASFSGISVTSNGNRDAFIAKYSSQGVIQWVQKSGGLYDDFGHGIKVDANYRVFVTGQYRYKTTFGTTTLTAVSKADMFVARYDANGVIQWARSAGGPLDDCSRALALDPSSNLVITGNYGNSCTFPGTTISGADSSDVFFASYDKSGNFRWVLKAGGAADKADPGRDIEMGLSIATDPSGNVVASGTYRSNSTFGNTTLAAWDHTDIFITKITQGTVLAKKAAPMVSPKDSASYCVGGYVTLQTVSDSLSDYVWMKDGKVIENSNGLSLRVTSPGIYCVLAILGGDTITSAPTTVVETRQIESTLTSSSKKFCKDSNSILTVNAGEGFTYQWKRNGRNITGATSQTFQPTKNGTYKARIVQGSCFGWSPEIEVDFDACNSDTMQKLITTINDIEDATDSLFVKVFPNPNNGLFTMELNMAPSMVSGQSVVVDVINSIGQIFYHKIIAAGNARINEQIVLESTVHTGIYFLRVTMGKVVETEKIMLVK